MNPTCAITSYDISMIHEQSYLVNLSWGELHCALSFSVVSCLGASGSKRGSTCGEVGTPILGSPNPSVCPIGLSAEKAREDRLHANIVESSTIGHWLYNTVFFHQFLCPSVLIVSSHSQNTPDNLQTTPYLLFINFNFPRTNEISQISFWIHLHSQTLKFLSCRNRKLLKCTTKSFIFLTLTPLKNTM